VAPAHVRPVQVPLGTRGPDVDRVDLDQGPHRVHHCPAPAPASTSSCRHCATTPAGSKTPCSTPLALAREQCPDYRAGLELVGMTKTDVDILRYNALGGRVRNHPEAKRALRGIPLPNPFSQVWELRQMHGMYAAADNILEDTFCDLATELAEELGWDSIVPLTVIHRTGNGVRLRVEQQRREPGSQATRAGAWSSATRNLARLPCQTPRRAQFGRGVDCFPTSSTPNAKRPTLVLLLTSHLRFPPRFPPQWEVTNTPPPAQIPSFPTFPTKPTTVSVRVRARGSCTAKLGAAPQLPVGTASLRGLRGRPPRCAGKLSQRTWRPGLPGACSRRT
jgi:hypothetical protein